MWKTNSIKMFLCKSGNIRLMVVIIKYLVVILVIIFTSLSNFSTFYLNFNFWLFPLMDFRQAHNLETFRPILTNQLKNKQFCWKVRVKKEENDPNLSNRSLNSLEFGLHSIELNCPIKLNQIICFSSMEIKHMLTKPKGCIGTCCT